MVETLKGALVITRREVYDQFRDWRIIFPVVVLTLVFPSMMNFTARQIINFVTNHNAPIIGDRLVPFLLMIVGFFPISVSLVIALESFVGEKERRSIEPLLSSPMSDMQIYLGKLLAAMVPPLLASFLGIVVYLIGVYRQLGWTPTPELLTQVVVLTIVQAVLMVSGAVVVSSQTTSVRAANLLSSFIVIPMTFIIQGESVVMFWARYNALWWVIFAEVIIAGLLIRMGVAHFNREELLGRELDSLNLGWTWRVFKSNFIGEAHSIGEWYRVEIPATLRRLRVPSLLMILALVIGAWVGISQANVFVLPAGLLRMENLRQGFVQGLEAMRFISAEGVATVWLHNLRAILLATILGIFTFGVLGILVLMLPTALIGYFAASVVRAGISPGVFLTALVLPHGLFEYPAMILTGAAIFGLGATLASPANGKTIGEAWLQAFAAWARIIVGLVLPLLFIAALVEVFVTPYVAQFMLGGGMP